jgi:Eco57I restriction-modification methylase
VIEERLAEAGPDPTERERALLDITVLDPACGSAAFLIAAVDRLATALADVRREGGLGAGDEQSARRDVLQHCIYAVDKDETAAELAKVALWIHCAVKDRPLTFLDHRIQHGDSLVGWPLLGRMPRTVPDGAFDATSKDDEQGKAARKAWKERNQEVRDPRFGEEPPPAPDPHLEPPPLVAAPEESPSDVHAKAAAWHDWRQSVDVRRLESAADLWTAAFLWRPDAGAAPTSVEYWAAIDGQTVSQREEAGRVASEIPFFHWSLRFPDIRERGGFDCVIGNPPWKQYKPDEREWFASRAPEIAALSSGDRKKAIDALAEKNPALDNAWRRHQAAIDRLAEFARHGGRYTPSGAEANTYLLFAELVADIVRSGGRAGILLKSQLALDKSAQGIFQPLLAEGRVAELHDIVNGGPTGTNVVFPSVDAKERFSVVGFTGRRTDADGFDATVMNWNVEEAATRIPRRFTRQTLATLNPRTKSLTSFRRNEELEVALDIHRRLRTLDFDEGGENPWGIAWVTLFHSSGANRKGLFHKREDLEADGWTLGRDKVFRRDGDVALPLYEGQLVNRWDHRAKTYEGYTGDNKYKPAPGIPETSDAQKANPDFEVEPRYWMHKPIVEERLTARVGDRVMLGFGNTGRAWREQRSAAGALLPRAPATHGLPLLAVAQSHALEFAAVFNSTVFDFRARGGMPGPNLGLAWMLSQIAAPEPGLDPRVAENSARLSLTSRSIAKLFDREPYHWLPDERYRLDVEIDALIALAYGLDREAYEIVLDSFEVMARMQTAGHGYYKLKEDCLAAFERLGAEAAQEVEVGPA